MATGGPGSGEFFEAGQVRIGFDDQGSGRPVVLLHAFPLDARMWQAQRAGLADVARVITPDQRGFGRSTGGINDEPSLDRAADDVARLLDHLGLGAAVLGGLSMGGYLSMAFLRRHPERVSGLLLCDTKASPDPDAAKANRLRIGDRVLAEGSAVLLEEVYPALVGETTKSSRPDVVAAVRALVAEVPPDAAAWAQQAMAARPDSVDTLHAVTVPTLVVRGDEDVLCSAADAELMADAARGPVVTLTGAGHLTALEVPAELTAVVRGWLAGLPSTG